MSTPAARFPAANLAIAVAFSGTVGVFVTEASINPVSVVFWRCVFAAPFLAAWCMLFGYFRSPRLAISGLLRAAASGVCMIVSWIALFAAFSMTSISIATIVYHVQPFFVVLIGVLLLKERVTTDQIFWMAAAFIGVAFASGLAWSPEPPGETWMLGIALSLFGALLYAAVTIIAKGLGEQRPEITILCQTMVGIVMLAPFADAASSIPPSSWPWLVAMGVLHTGIIFVAMVAAYPKLSTPTIGVITFIYPAVAILADWAIYDHPLGLLPAVGMILIAVGTLGVKLGWRVFRREASAS